MSRRAMGSVCEWTVSRARRPVYLRLAIFGLIFVLAAFAVDAWQEGGSAREWESLETKLAAGYKSPRSPEALRHLDHWNGDKGDDLDADRTLNPGKVGSNERDGQENAQGNRNRNRSPLGFETVFGREEAMKRFGHFSSDRFMQKALLLSVLSMGIGGVVVYYAQRWIWGGSRASENQSPNSNRAEWTKTVSGENGATPGGKCGRGGKGNQSASAASKNSLSFDHLVGSEDGGVESLCSTPVGNAKPAESSTENWRRFSNRFSMEQQSAAEQDASDNVDLSPKRTPRAKHRNVSVADSSPTPVSLIDTGSSLEYLHTPPRNLHKRNSAPAACNDRTPGNGTGMSSEIFSMNGNWGFNSAGGTPATMLSNMVSSPRNGGAVILVSPGGTMGALGGNQDQMQLSESIRELTVTLKKTGTDLNVLARSQVRKEQWAIVADSIGWGIVVMNVASVACAVIFGSWRDWDNCTVYFRWYDMWSALEVARCLVTSIVFYVVGVPMLCFSAKRLLRSQMANRTQPLSSPLLLVSLVLMAIYQSFLVYMVGGEPILGVGLWALYIGSIFVFVCTLGQKYDTMVKREPEEAHMGNSEEGAKKPLWVRIVLGEWFLTFAVALIFPFIVGTGPFWSRGVSDVLSAQIENLILV